MSVSNYLSRGASEGHMVLPQPRFESTVKTVVNSDCIGGDERTGRGRVRGGGVDAWQGLKTHVECMHIERLLRLRGRLR